MILHGLAHCVAAVDGVLDSQPMRHFVEHRVLEKGVERDVVALVRGDQQLRNGYQDLVELGTHRIFELKSPRSFGELHRLVVGQVDRNRLATGVAVAGVVHDVVGAEICVRAGHLFFIGVRHRQPLLQHRQVDRKSCQPLAPGHILDHHQAGVGGAVAEETVFVGFDGADHQLDGVGLHLHPGHIGGAVIIGFQRIGSQPQVIGEPGVFRHAGSTTQQFTGRLQLLGIRLVIGQ